jgi:hypothetical protein
MKRENKENNKKITEQATEGSTLCTISPTDFRTAF